MSEAAHGPATPAAAAPAAAVRTGAAAGAPAYRARAGDPERARTTVLEVWRGNLGDDARMPRKYDWFYLHAPAGLPLLHLLDHHDTAAATPPGTGTPSAAAVVGACALGQRRMLHRGAPVRAGVLVDLAVLPAHRSLGPALMLQQDLFAAGRARLDVLYGFPNPKAAPVFKRIGYRALGEMVRYVRVVRTAPYLRRRLPGALAPLAALAGPVLDIAQRLRTGMGGSLARNWSTRVPDLSALWTDSVKPEALTAIRENAYLRWRFDEAPDAGFRHLLLSAGDRAEAWFATRSDGHTLHVLDFWQRGAGATPDASSLHALLAAAHDDGHAAVSVELATSTERLQPWLALGFEARSRRPIFGHVSADSSQDATFDLHLTSADEDE